MNRPTRPDPERYEHPYHEHPYADADLRPVLAAAMDDIRITEPGMPDLLGPAMAEGSRLRRKRRTNLLVALSAAGALVLGGVVGGIAYLGGDTAAGPAGRPDPSTGMSAGDGRTAAEALVRAVEPHLGSQGVAVAPDLANVRQTTEFGGLVVLNLRNERGATGQLILTSSPIAGGATATVPGETPGGSGSCGLVLKYDRTSPPYDYDDHPTCKKLSRGPAGSQVWTVQVEGTQATGGTGLVAGVRLGPGDTVARAYMWTNQSPESPSATFVLDPETLAALAADPAVTEALKAVPMPSPSPGKSESPPTHQTGNVVDGSTDLPTPSSTRPASSGSRPPTNT